MKMHPSSLKTIAVLICVLGLCENAGNQGIDTVVILNTVMTRAENGANKKLNTTADFEIKLMFRSPLDKQVVGKIL